MQNEKKYDFGTLLKLLFITANQIAYPQSAPANTSNRQRPVEQKKYGVLDYRNITDNQGWLPIKIDYSKFKPKKYYVDAQQQTLENHLKALQKKQNLLKQFKHHQDFDRIDYLASYKSNTFENNIQKILMFHVIFAAIVSRITMVKIYTHHYSSSLWYHYFKKTYLYTIPIVLTVPLFYQHASPINHEYFRSTPKQIRMYEALAYDVDAFQYVNDIKYNFKYPQRTQFYKTSWNAYEKRTQSQYSDAINYYKRVYGIVDPEPFWKKEKPQSQKQTV